MKAIGVIGGISAQATMDFEVRLHRAAQRHIPPNINSGYPPLYVYYHRRPPYVMATAIAPALPIQADPALLEAAQWLGQRADFLIIGANGAHLIQVQIEQAAGRPVFSMIAATLEEVRRRGWQKIGVLGFQDPRVSVYTRPLEQLGLTAATIDPAMQGAINTAVIKVMEGREDAEATQAVTAAITALRRRGVDGIILGCTELPLLLPEVDAAADLLHPIDLLADAAVRHALE